ncbi:PREDICTED: aldehyde oxidase-like [Elephantulus edwardii]|uniref:aldehyde oxidase-like n=1 Tax=Elephantulus edwardii TaxID=28737 RepID=UPI0003F0E8C2|nr:PREDICTED: aldehyde oxidase-like [Elephantulus edwardii]
MSEGLLRLVTHTSENRSLRKEALCPGIMPSLPNPDKIIFFINGRKVTEENADPETPLLHYVRTFHHLTGTKYACGSGACGACTVMVSRYDPKTKKIHHYPATACLLPVGSLHGAAVTTVEGVGSIKTRIHPVQERLAKCHGTQCGFCSPGMVMSIYTLLRNHPEPTPEQVTEALGGNLCRCTGYRPIVESGKTFCVKSTVCQMKGSGKCCMDQEESSCVNKPEKICTKLYDENEFQPFDPTQEPIFPPELIRMAEDPNKRRLTFQGTKTTWIIPVTLDDLLELKITFPSAPIIMGNTAVGPSIKFKDAFYPVFISPVGLPELCFADATDSGGVTIGAGYSLAQLTDTLLFTISEQPKEKTQTHRALLKHLRTLAGLQIRNIATLGGHVVSRPNYSDLNPILAAGNATINLRSKDGERQIAINGQFLERVPEADLKSEEIVLSVNIPYSTQWEFVAGLRQAQRQENAFAIVNAGMSVTFEEGTNTIKDLKMFYGSVGPTVASAPETCKELTGRQWNDQMLSDACRLVLAEIHIPPDAEGGMVEYRRTLIISLLFKFYLKVKRGLNKIDPQKFPDIPEKFVSALEDFPIETPQGLQMFQCVDPHQSPQDPVGHPVMHKSAIKHTTGEAVYCDDIPPVADELFLAVVTSTRAHAKIMSIDTSEVLAHPGVVDVVTAEDVPGDNNHSGEVLYAQNKVICVGQIVCTVAADTYLHAKEAAKKVKIAYEDIEPRIITIEQALEHNSFLSGEKKIEQGNIDEAFKHVDHIIEGEVHVEGQEHFYMETQSILAIPKQEDKEMVLHLGTQFPTHVQEFVAGALNIPRNRVECCMRRAGGAFGGKVSKPSLLGAVCAVAANKTGRPIRFILERGDDMLITAGRHPLYCKYKIGFMENGVIKAADVEYYVNGGCTPDESEMVVEFLVLKSENAYHIPNFRCRGRPCKTNLPSNTAFRGFGYPQATVVVEAYINTVAAHCNLLPEEVKEINMFKKLSKTAYGQTFNPEPLRRCWKECLEKSSFHARKQAAEEFNQKNYWKKRGLAVIPMKYTIGIPISFYNQAAALVHIYLDGSVMVIHGGCEIGQGLYTKMIQVASRELNIPESYIHSNGTSTVAVPNAVFTAGSMGTDANGRAVQNACQILMARLQPIIRENPEGKWEEWITKAFAESISLSATGYFKGYQTNMDWEKGKGEAFPYFVYGAACSEVEVDCLTGAHKLLRTDIFMDAAFSINPAIDIGQVEGAFIQGMGLYTIEELKYSPEGVLLSRGPDDYQIPTVTEIPEEIYVTLVHSQNPIAIYSSKGLGEAGMFLGSSVLFAIYDAVTAARKERGLTKIFPMNSPVTPELIRMTCMDQFTDMIPRDDPSTFTPWSIHVS